MPSDLANKIRNATLAGLAARDRYTSQITLQLTKGLNTSQNEISKAILKYKSLGSLPDNKLAALNGLEKLQLEISDILKQLKKDHTLIFRKSSKESFKKGITQGITEFTHAKMPFYKDFNKDGIDKLTTKVFTIVDTDALDFMTQYNLTLAGDVHRELSDGIKRTILSGIASGKSSENIVRDLGGVVIDKESFRQAGTKVFSKAQYRMELIARTEILRAHNMGRLKFHERVGIQKLEWLATEDERMCRVCGDLDGKEYVIKNFPQQPAHPNCRCTNVITWPNDICGTSLASKASVTAPVSDACILPPHVLENMADAQAQENSKLKKVFESGNQAELGLLTVKQLQTIAKQNGVAIARTKSDFIKLLDIVEPGIVHNDLAGEALTLKLKQYNIGLLRTKDELISLLVEKQNQLKIAQEQAAALSKVVPSDLKDLTAKELKDLAKEHGISLNMTKEETIELLDLLEPGIDHSSLKGIELSSIKAKYGIGILKNKEQLVTALQKKAGANLAEQAKMNALEEAQKNALIQKKQKITESVQKITVPSTPLNYKAFISNVNEAEIAIAAGKGLPNDVLESHLKEIVIKKQAFKEQISQLKLEDLKKAAKETQLKYWQWANKEELLILFTETDSVKVSNVKASIDAKHAAWALKHGGGKKAVLPEPFKPIKDNVPVLNQNKPTSKVSEFEKIDTDWINKKAQSQFKFSSKANIEGAHEKEFWTDENGDIWLFKPVKKGDEFIVYGEEAAYKIARLIDKKQIEVRTISLNGRLGSIQPWRKDLAKDFDFRSVNPIHLTTLELEQIQREQVIDWLISNHDAHSKQFLRSKDGVVYGIDKGQVFKFLGSDFLSIDYHPNKNCGEEEPYYNKVFRAVKNSEIKIDPQVTLRYIQEVEKISDSAYVALIRPYAEGRFANSELLQKQFIEQALDRKHNLRKDFERYYSEVFGKKKFTFEGLDSQVNLKKIGLAEKILIEEAKELGWQGKALPFDGNDVEDQNALIFSEALGNQKRTVIKMKIRPNADKSLVSKMRLGLHENENTPIPLSQDIYYQDILRAIKHISHHVDDGNYEAPKIEIGLRHRSALQKILTSSNDKDLREMAGTYLKWIDEIELAYNQKREVSGFFKQYLKLPENKLNQQLGYQTIESGVQSTLRKIHGGYLTVEDDDASNKKVFKTDSISSGKQYTVKFTDGTIVRYCPWSDDNLYAQQGSLEILHTGDISGEQVEKMLNKLETLGVNTTIAKLENAEYMYLQKMAYIRKVDTNDKYKTMMNDFDKRGASLNERVVALRSFWQNELNVKDLTKLPDYNPQGDYQAGFTNRKLKGGYRHQYRFDISDDDLETEMKDYRLYHELTNSSEMSSFLEQVFENNGAMVSTIEKVRIGITPGGMSPVQDMHSGGASYFFTRIRKASPQNPDRGGLYFKKQLLRRMDAISYSHDAYGKVKDNYVHSHRAFSINEFKKFAGKEKNETIFKYSVTLLDNIDYIVVLDKKEREKILQLFRKKGIEKLPDGRSVESIIIAKY